MKFIYTLITALSLGQAYGQVGVWNKQLPISSNSTALQISLQPYENGYLISSQKNILTLNQYGEITGDVFTPFNVTNYSLGSIIRPKIDLITGEKYFLLASNNLTGANAMAISEYRPGQGFLHQTLLDEMWGSSAFSPVFIDLNDSTYIVLGRKYFRQITHRPGQGVIINWEKPNTLGNPNAGVKTAQGVVGVSQNGVVFALDDLGNTIWADTTDYILRDIKITDNGFLAVGSSADTAAVLIKFSSNGFIEWSKAYANDLVFNNLIIEGNGNFTITGQSDSLAAVLLHLAPDGSIIWRHTYQKGEGRTLLQATNGYVVVGQQSSQIFIFKTDETGFTAAQERSLDPRKRRIENDQLRVVASPSANLFFDLQNSFLGAPDSLTSLFVSAAPWLGAIDQDDLLHAAANTYPDNHFDFRSGFSKSNATDFNRVWQVSRKQIKDLQQDWADNGVLDQPIPFDISSWPAKGNEQFAYNLDFTKTTIDKSLLPAPFVDANGDGLYAPADGDYPRIKGDQMAWWMLTDSTIHTRTNGRAFVVDMGVSMYTYDCPQLAQMDRSLIVDFELINRSDNTYHQSFAGIWVEQDLGCANAKRLGSLPISNAFYTYRRDTIHDSTCPVPSFDSTNAVTAVSFINQSLDKFIYYNNGGATPTPPPATSEPNQDIEYYHYLRGRWRDGSVPTYNGQPVDFLFPDNPADATGNSMCTNPPLYPDRRMIGSHGPFDFAPNDTFRLSVAFTYHPDIHQPCPDIFGTVKNDIDQLHTLINSGALETPPYLVDNTHLAPGQTVLLNATVPDATAYLWSNGATTPTINVTQVGEYSVTITRSTGCTTVELVRVSAATPVHEPDWLEYLQLFPNPNAGQFKVEVRGTARENIEISFYNTLGQLVQQQVSDFQSGSFSQKFYYSNLPSGIYTLRLRAGEKMQYVKVVLQH